ncbi:hypothetical protein [Nostoc sphaeroides]|uniref:hypothetical protein n=1 Tax=Nostoc sphaeroides TaxID=446679 RepID=UPI001883A44C|nr:hypothetical protein [Nostoc sphaeroides]
MTAKINKCDGINCDRTPAPTDKNSRFLDIMRSHRTDKICWYYFGIFLSHLPHPNCHR